MIIYLFIKSEKSSSGMGLAVYFPYPVMIHIGVNLGGGDV